MATTTQADEQLLARYALATRYFRDFLPFVRITESGSGVIPFEMWPHVEDMMDDLELERLISWAKSRQITATTILSAYALWHASFVTNGWVLDISKGQEDSHEFLAKSKDIWSNLPEPLKAERGGTDNQGHMSFANGGKIEALPSTPDAGRGRNPTLVIFDEADFHDYLEEAINSVKPGLDDRGGQLIQSSTWSPYKIGSLFQKTYQNPNNGYKKRFFPYNVRPGRTEEWYQARKAEAEDQALFEKEFPRTEEEMMAPANAIAFFDLPTIRKMQADEKEPIEVITVGNGVSANIYQYMQPGKRYTAATDTSHGVGKDFSVTVVLDVVTGYVVADIYSSVIDTSELGTASVELLRNYYDSPIWGIEMNAEGSLTLRMAQELKYRRIYKRDDDGEKPGWLTYDTASHMEPGSRYVVFGDLYRAIKSRAITIPNKEGLAQFMTVIRNPKKMGRVEAMEGGHDDYPMAVGIAWQLRTSARPAGSINMNNPDLPDDQTFNRRRHNKGHGRYGWAGVMR